MGAITAQGAEGGVVLGAVGGIVGLVAGFDQERNEYNDKIVGCIIGRGYTLTR